MCVSCAGNLGRVDMISSFEYDLFIRPDTCSEKYVCSTNLECIAVPTMDAPAATAVLGMHNPMQTRLKATQPLAKT